MTGRNHGRKVAGSDGHHMNGSVVLVANPLQTQKLGEQVLRVIAGRIINGEIGEDRPPPTEQDICAEFGISKTTAREVIGSLVSKGLVDVRHGRRMRVRAPSEWNHLDPLLLELRDDPASVTRYMADLHDVRMMLEPEMAARAAMLATPIQLARMRDAVELLPTLESDPDAYLEVDIAFHSDLAEASGNVVLAYILESVRELLRASRQALEPARRAPGGDPVPPPDLRRDPRARARDGAPGDACAPSIGDPCLGRRPGRPGTGGCAMSAAH